MNKILITGGTGFIGNSLIPILWDNGFQVRLLVRKTPPAPRFQNNKIEMVQGSLQDPASLAQAVQGVDGIIHLAGIVSASKKEQFYEVNAQGSKNLIQAVVQNNPSLKKFIYVSSLAAGGPLLKRDERTEDMPDGPVSHYGKSKLEGEKEVLKYKEQIPMVILRPSIVYGPEDKGVFIIIKSAYKKIIPVLKAGNSEKQKFYSMIYVKDLCRSLAFLINKNDVQTGEVFYISDGSVYSMEDILNSVFMIAKKNGTKVPVPFSLLRIAAHFCEWFTQFTGKPLPLNRDKLNELKPDYWTCSNKKLHALGFESHFPLHKGMHETIAWYKENKWL